MRSSLVITFSYVFVIEIILFEMKGQVTVFIVLVHSYISTLLVIVVIELCASPSNHCPLSFL